MIVNHCPTLLPEHSRDVRLFCLIGRKRWVVIGENMEAYALSNSPFAVLTAIVAPAVLTNASSVLGLGTSNRLARVVDRTRVVASELATLDHDDPERPLWAAQVGPLRVRAGLLVRSLRFFYGGLGLFAASALVSVGGPIAAYCDQRLGFEVCAALAIVTGACAVLALCSGCGLMVRETQLAVRNIEHEAQVLSETHRLSHATKW
jgi:uncharacterized membrane protein